MIGSLPSLIRNKVGGALLNFVFLLMLGFFEFIKINSILVELGQQVLYPILRINAQAGTQLYQFGQNLSHWHNSARRVQDLELKLARTSAQLSQIELLERENQKLRELLNSSDRSLDQVVLTSPILSLAQPAVGLPRNSEVHPGSAVLVEGTLVGVVSQVKNNVGYVCLLWQRDCPYVLAQTQTGVQGLLVGDGRRVLLTEVPIEQEIEVGHRVVTSGQVGIDVGLYVGEVLSIKSGSSPAVKTAVIEQYVNFHEATLVEIKL